jgi:GNAT superfamily N-acetyltransferase
VLAQSVTAVRLITADDIPSAWELSTAAGWNQTSNDWRKLIELDPKSCFGLECEGRLVATTTLVCYGRRLAWVGMVLTRAGFQRRGFARTLVARALEFADSRGIGTVKLDATAQGQPLYESLGFVPEQEVQRWSGNVSRDSLPSPNFGPPANDGEEFARRREGLRASYLGPCRARTQESARRLIATTLATSEGAWLWDLLPANRGAVSLAEDFGFRLDRQLVRMSRGAPLREDESMIYAISGFEFGS